MPYELLSKIAKRFKALSSEKRLHLLQLIQQGGLRASEMADALQEPLPNLMRLLKNMEENGLIRSELGQDGANHYYLTEDGVRFAEFYTEEARKEVGLETTPTMQGVSAVDTKGKRRVKLEFFLVLAGILLLLALIQGVRLGEQGYYLGGILVAAFILLLRRILGKREFEIPMP